MRRLSIYRGMMQCSTRRQRWQRHLNEKNQQIEGHLGTNRIVKGFNSNTRGGIRSMCGRLNLIPHFQQAVSTDDNQFLFSRQHESNKFQISSKIDQQTQQFETPIPTTLSQSIFIRFDLIFFPKN
jgi:hypothetical protein